MTGRKVPLPALDAEELDELILALAGRQSELDIQETFKVAGAAESRRITETLLTAASFARESLR